MCGIFGVLDFEKGNVTPGLVIKAVTAIRHRGPDDEGYLLGRTATGEFWLAGGRETPERVWASNYAYSPRQQIGHTQPDVPDLAMASRRLAIQDLSPAGHQPMCNEDGSLWIVFNGEIYNFQQIRQELQQRGHTFTSHTDTEVILHAYEEWGAECLQHFNGMWAFAIWDRKRKKLFCSRDRFGVKPFYYSFDGKIFIFSSEIKGLLETGLVPREVNNRIIFDYLGCGLVDHGEETFFSGIRRIPAGCYLEIGWDDRTACIRRYYDLCRNAESAVRINGYDGRFYEIFEDSIRLRLISDVPVGSCLSGGLDSSSIVCMVDKLMREGGLKLPRGEGMQKTFSARYEDNRHDEGSFIDQVVRKTGVDARFTYPTGKGLLEDVTNLIRCQEEPFGSTSIYAQWKVFKLIKESGVTVALDGQGADELLAGYHDYFIALFSHLLTTFQLQALAREFGACLQLHRKRACRDLLLALSRAVPKEVKAPLGWLRGTKEKDWVNKKFASSFNPNSFPGQEEDCSLTSFDRQLFRGLLLSDLPSYLRYEDKNSMFHSIESRLPFLDYRLVEFAFSLPWEQKIFRGTTKYVLRTAMTGVVPELVRNRRDKIGFSTPEDVWFRTDLADAISSVIDSESFQKRAFFDGDQVTKLFRAHRSGRQNQSATLWRCLNLELWLRAFID